MKFKSFTFNPFQENTYIIYDETRQCVIVDPGCSNPAEEQTLASFIESNGLEPVLLLNTHGHIDHILGNLYVHNKYKIPVWMHKSDLPFIDGAVGQAAMFGVPLEQPPRPDKFIDENDTIEFGNTKLEILFTPGHSPGSISFYHRDSGVILSGDVLFAGSIGRVDLPGGDYDTLIRSIKNELLPLGDDVKVLSGHGPETRIRIERKTNPFLT